VLGVAEVIVELTLQRGLEHRLGQPGQQPTLPGQPQPLRPGSLGQLPDQLLIDRLQRIPAGERSTSPPPATHISHRCLLQLRSYTNFLRVPAAASAAGVDLRAVLWWRARSASCY
jgi:hypothetical protein